MISGTHWFQKCNRWKYSTDQNPLWPGVLEQVLQGMFVFCHYNLIGQKILENSSLVVSKLVVDLVCKVYGFLIKLPISRFHEFSMVSFHELLNQLKQVLWFHFLLLLSSKNLNLVEHFREYLKFRIGIWDFVNVVSKVICTKYSKHWPYTVAIDCVCSKILNHGLFLSLFKLIPCHIHWIVFVLAYLNFIFEF